MSGVRQELLAPGRREVTVGIVLLISLVAFEAMGVSTAMPALIADLGSVSSYAWPFVSFVAANVVGTVLGGRWCDARGPGRALLVAPATFGVGLVVAGTADTMTQLLGGRVLQGLGSGVLGVAVYVLIAEVYPARVQPAVFGLISSAWVVPSLLGPPISGWVTERWSWHVVFLGLLPLVVLATALVLPAVRSLVRGPDEAQPQDAGRRAPVVAALGAAAGVAALSWAGERPTLTGLAVVVVGLVVLVPSVARLWPTGTARARAGAPAVVAARGLVAGAFFTVNAYLPLLLTAQHGWSLAAAGVPLIVGSLGWSASAAWQARHPDVGRGTLVRLGFLGIAAGAGGLVVAAPQAGPAWVSLPLWGVAGLGMGLAFSSLSYLLLQASATSDVGYHSAAAQLTDQLSQAVFIGAGGAVIAAVDPRGLGLTLVLGVVVVLAVLGAVVAPRTAPGPHGPGAAADQAFQGSR
ncbi:MFS transporter [Nocardioides mangrovicus]|uniref:MFS transporter n=1 Tax=Nocardioides mangrovicus TaxID=2478913 RepID=A0A3L8NX79_9ACTN|nr:MFS transporter [Nocardioides mangrovicus]RLV47770.1 MFS transporter [Nocardioides mangrovicus]